MKRSTKLSIIILFLVIFAASSLKVIAAGNIYGWLWGGSEEGVLVNGLIDRDETELGWISTSSSNCDTDGDGFSDGGLNCPGIGTVISDYGVTIPPSDGNITGYAWSEHVGWINFDAAGPYPIVSTGDDYTHSVQRSGDSLIGWARIVGIQGELASSNSGGWEGWIRMSSDSNDLISYGITMNLDGTFNPCSSGTNCAWSDELGWVDFSNAKMLKTLKVCANSCNGASLLASNVNITENGTLNLVACYNQSSACDDSSGDVTDLATWTKDTTPNDAFMLNDSGSPVIITGNNIPEPTTAILFLEEGLSVEYNDGTPHTSSHAIRVNNMPFCGNDVAEPSEDCDGVDVASCSVGDICVAPAEANECTCETPSTSSNWREVAP